MGKHWIFFASSSSSLTALLRSPLEKALDCEIDIYDLSETPDSVHRPACILLDLKDDDSSEAALKRWREAYPSVPVIVITVSAPPTFLDVPIFSKDLKVFCLYLNPLPSRQGDEEWDGEKAVMALLRPEPDPFERLVAALKPYIEDASPN